MYVFLMTVLCLGIVVCILWLWTKVPGIPCNPRLKRADFGGFHVCSCLIALLPDSNRFLGILFVYIFVCLCFICFLGFFFHFRG